MERNGQTLKPSNQHGIVHVLACTQQLLYARTLLSILYTVHMHVRTYICTYQ